MHLSLRKREIFDNLAYWVKVRSLYMRSIIALAMTIGLLTSCSYNSQESTNITRYHDDGRAKPIVAILPVIDHSGQDFPWNLSEELSYAVYNRIMKRGNFWIDSFAQNVKIAHQIPKKVNLFGKDLSWIKPRFPEHEFVVVLELIEHDIHIKQTKNTLIDKLTPSCELEMAVRIRVVDIRGDTPAIVLQEVIAQSNLIPRQSGLNDKEGDRWKQRTYAVSPLGFSHLQLSKEIVRRLEEYIILAKSK